MFVFKAAVIGAGVMGAQIAQVIAAAADLPVVVKDLDRERAQAGVAEAIAVTERRAERWVQRATATREQAQWRVQRVRELLHATDSYEDLRDVDLVIEAVPEDLPAKQQVFAELDAHTPGHALLATNTSSLSVMSIADAVSPSRRSRVLGLHFFWPAAAMRVVEVVASEDTSPEAVQAAANFVQQARKAPIRSLDSPGFVVNRILGSMNSELWAFQEQSATAPAEIDDAVRASGLLPMGPFEVADQIGLDTVVRVARELQEAHGNRYGVHAGMLELIEQGHLGAKTGRGFYEH
ncbi:MAG: 3-hydroxyacyl-CoA dehydrogenase family protein [Actinomycetota bacterium]|nr:3-hydroxyacyl-CoA dehydrogenase family protein [Actinomycetota bacterium]